MVKKKGTENKKGITILGNPTIKCPKCNVYQLPPTSGRCGNCGRKI